MKMINLFKRKQAKQSTSVAVSETINKNESVDQQIYNDVYSAQELLLNEANRILSEPLPYDNEKYERLKKLCSLGFGNADEVKRFTEIDRIRNERQALKERIEYYNQTYPLNKFIDRDAVKTICEKYGLLLTESKDYIAEIPEKNQKEIVDFKVKRKDARKPTEVGSAGSWMQLQIDMGFNFPTEERTKYLDTKISGTDFLIIAPAHKLDLSNKTRNGHIMVREIKDPIVLQPVHGGYLIVSSWGLEASDELVVNSINN